MKIVITDGDESIGAEGVNFDDAFSNLRTGILKLLGDVEPGSTTELTVSVTVPAADNDGDI